MKNETEILPVFIPEQIVMCRYTEEERAKIGGVAYHPVCFFGKTESLAGLDAILLGFEVESFAGIGYMVDDEEYARAHHATLKFNRTQQNYNLNDKDKRVIVVEPIFDLHEIETRVLKTNERGIIPILRELTKRLS